MPTNKSSFTMQGASSSQTRRWRPSTMLNLPRRVSLLLLSFLLFASSSSIRVVDASSQRERRIRNHPTSTRRLSGAGAATPAVALASSSSSRKERIIKSTTTKSSSSILKGLVAGGNNTNNTGGSAIIVGMKNFIASGCAAGCSKLILAPFDTIKTLQQHQRSSLTAGATLSFVEAAKTIMSRPRGVWELYSGVGVAVIGSMPSVGLYFGVYSFCKKTLFQWCVDDEEEDGSNAKPNKKTQQQKRKPRFIRMNRTMAIALSAAIGNTVASASRVPYEVVKQKLQTNTYTSLGHALQEMSWKTIFPTGGIASQMLRDVPYAIATLLAYEHLKYVWKPKFAKRYPTVLNQTWDLLIGGIAGGFGSYLTNPMDVIKTRLQTSSDLYGGSIRTCFMSTWEEGGMEAFLRGSVPRLLHKVPANAFFFVFYETFRSLLKVVDE